MKPSRTIAAVLEQCVAISGLVSIDVISTRFISTPALGFLKLFTAEYNDLRGLEAGSRMISISGNANVFAGYIGLGMLLSLGLALSSESAKERMGHVVCLFINALSFVLAFSMGASGVIVAAIPTPWLTKRVSGGVVAAVAALVLIFFVMLYNCMAARQVAQQSTFDSLERAAKMDKFEWADYALSYAVSAQGSDVDAETREKADEFTAKLGKVDSNAIPVYLAEHYFFTDRMDLAFDVVERYVNYVFSKPATWEAAFEVLEYHAKDTDA